MGNHSPLGQYDIFASSHSPCDWQATPVLEEESGRLIFGEPQARRGVDNITQAAGKCAAIALKSSRGSLEWMRLQSCSGPICSHLPHSRRTEGMLTACFCTLMREMDGLVTIKYVLGLINLIWTGTGWLTSLHGKCQWVSVFLSLWNLTYV